MYLIRHLKKRILLLINYNKRFLLIVFLQFILLGSLNAQTVEGLKTTLKVSDATLVQIFNNLEISSGYNFKYSDEIANDPRKFSYNLPNIFLEDIFKKIAKDAGLVYKINGKDISVKKVDKIKLKGKVSDSSTGEPLTGVSVVIKGTAQGTVTDFDGNYSVMVYPNATLQFSFIGYEIYETGVNGKHTVDVDLQTVSIGIDEVVAIGYGTEKKVDLTGAVDNINKSILRNRPMPNAARGLEGALPGVFVNMPSGSPTQDFSPIVRGQGSIGAGGSALVLIDGVPGELNTLNPSDIEDITVLKDAAASAIYGARGAFGVVLVTTKNPETGSMEMNYSYNYSFNTRAIKPELLTDGYLWAKNFDEAYYQWSYNHPTTINTGMKFSQERLAELERMHEQGEDPKIDIDPSTGEYVYYGSTDWQKLLYADHNPSKEHKLTISGGTKTVKYYVAGRYFNQHGIFNYSPDTFKQFNIRQKGSVQLYSWLSVGNNFSYSQRSYFYPLSVRSPGTNILRRLTDEFNPLSFLQNPDGTLTKSAALTFGSFLTGGNFKKQKWQEVRNTFDFEAGFFNDDLKVNGNFSYIYRPYLEEQQATPVPYSIKPGEILTMDVNQDYAGEKTSREDYKGVNLYASYGHRSGKHQFKVLAGYNYENTDHITRYYKRNKMINPALPDPGLLTGSDIQLTGGGYEWTTSGTFFRVNYNYDERYLLAINGRYDGSSKFPIGQEYGFFPSVSVGWRVSNEGFWDVSPNFISNLKLRVSYGSLGNGNVSPYQFLETMPVNTLGRVINGSKPLYTNNPNVIPDGLTWEKTTTANFGLDAGFLQNKLMFGLDIYERKTTGMFTQGIPLPDAFGASVPKGNYADMRTPGWELTLSWKNKSRNKKEISYSIELSLSDNYTVVDKFNNPEGLIEEFYKGKRLGDMWGYKVTGFYQTEEELASAPDQTQVYVTSRDKQRLKIGDLKFIDLDGDGKITKGTLTLDNKGDLIKIGNSQPRYLFGLNGDFEWNNFSFSVFFQGIGKREWWPGSENWLFWGQFNRPYTSMPMDVHNEIWSPENPGGYFPNLVGYESLNNNRTKAMNSPSTYFLQNAAYIRLKNLSIGYDLPESIISKVKLKKARVYFTGQNLWAWSPLFKVTKAIDPEAIGSQADTGSETDTYLMKAIESNKGSVYPILKTFTFGLDITI